ncbi:MAG: hypothetical protein OEY86_14605 [Nitrospira sp.]|nr:hypothetical protein [Nitrospira sp.]
MRDLSSFGCCIQSAVPMIPDLSLTLRIEVPNWNSPLTIRAARVQWVDGIPFDVGAFQTTEAERRQLRRFILIFMAE